MRLRHDIQLLSDSGVINIPTTTWPLSFPDISGRLLSFDKTTLDPEIQIVFERMKTRILQEMRRGFSDVGLRAAGTHNPLQLRTFEYTPRGTGEIEAHSAWMGDHMAARLNISGVLDAEDDEPLRFDGSYLTFGLGNWNLSFGQQPRWWGPGWEDSLILSTNARPVPTLSVERNYSTPFETPWLSWLGPWKLTGFIGQLEDFGKVDEKRFGFISNTKLVGARFSFKPTSKVEIGLVRTALWGGDGHPQGFGSFFDLLIGNDNERGQRQPGNQLAGYDVRWRSPLFGNYPYAIYSQFIGEDLAGLPYKYIGQAGIEVWGTNDALSGSWRAHFEWSDTLASFYKDSPEYGIAYNHHIYRQGYRYHGRSLGAAIDNDGVIFSFGFLFVDDVGSTWNAVVRRGEVNRDGAGYNPMSSESKDFYSVYLSHRRNAWKGNLILGIGGHWGSDKLMGRDQNFHFTTQYTLVW